MELSSVIRACDWDWIIKSVAAQSHFHGRKITNRQVSKFVRLSSDSCTTFPPLESDRIVVNLSGEELNQATVSVLSKGLNFAPAPKFIPVKEIVSGVEQAINVLLWLV